jgi:hypothetical protein
MIDPRSIQANEAEVRSLKAYLQRKRAEQKIDELRKLKVRANCLSQKPNLALAYS